MIENQKVAKPRERYGYRYMTSENLLHFLRKYQLTPKKKWKKIKRINYELTRRKL